MRFPDDLIPDLHELQWWNYKFYDFGGFNTEDPAEFIQQLRDKINSGSLTPYVPTPITNDMLV
jgi:hypothetical protein